MVITFITPERDFMLDIAFRSTSQRIVLFGPSGAGKSLTLQTIAGLITPDEGEIVLNGTTLLDTANAIDLSPQARRIAYLFQDCAVPASECAPEHCLWHEARLVESVEARSPRRCELLAERRSI
jgi:ABC-type molybdate transport system ATPase subunit